MENHEVGKAKQHTDSRESKVQIKDQDRAGLRRGLDGRTRRLANRSLALEEWGNGRRDLITTVCKVVTWYLTSRYVTDTFESNTQQQRLHTSR
jgi:hypothetical protein